MKLPVNHALPLIFVAALAGCGDGGSAIKPLPPVANGPAADYPVVVGPPFKIGAITYTPDDRLNYDAVGYAEVGMDGGQGISAAHKTLPLPSYAEVTSLESGRTILVRVERRGPMNNEKLVELSPGAAAQLGIAGSARPAVRLRRVNPPEQERAMLRAGGRGPERMETPRGLLDALNRKLGNEAGTPAARAASVASAPQPTPSPSPKPAAIPTPMPTPMPAQTASATPRRTAEGSLVVQVASFSTQERAKAAAGKIDGTVSPAGRFWRLHLGPFATRAQAEAALAKAKTAGYSDARIQRAD